MSQSELFRKSVQEERSECRISSDNDFNAMYSNFLSRAFVSPSLYAIVFFNLHTEPFSVASGLEKGEVVANRPLCRVKP